MMAANVAISASLALLVLAPGLSAQGTNSVIPQPVGIQAPKPDSARDTTAVPVVKEYHGERWTLIGGIIGAVTVGGATAVTVAPMCSDSGTCSPVKAIAIGAGVGFLVVGFVTGLIYGLFNG